MRFKVVVVDLELSRRGKRFATLAVALLIAVTGGAIAFAGVTHTWNTGDMLVASDLNGALSALDLRITALEGKSYTGTSGVAVSGTTISADANYLQRRIATACADGKSISAVAADGMVTCTAPNPMPVLNLESGMIYQNTSGRKLLVNCFQGAVATARTMDGHIGTTSPPTTLVTSVSGTERLAITFVVPPNHYYSATTMGPGTNPFNACQAFEL